jgi:hypothetical protein
VVVDEELLGLLGEGRPVGGAVLLDDLDLAAEHAAGVVDLLDRQLLGLLDPVSEIAMVPVIECRMPTVTSLSVTARPVVLTAEVGGAAQADRGISASAGAPASPMSSLRRSGERKP